VTLVRTPPRPAFEARARHERICPMCGGIPYTKRAHWHPECVVLWNLATHAALQIHELKVVADRCWNCGLTARASMLANGRLQERDLDRGPYRVLPLELEHIKPLWSLSAAERRELKWWLPFNLQLLCHWCHLAKSAREAAERAAPIRRAYFDAKAEDQGLVPLLPEIGHALPRRRAS
jgi:hypothetical protein